MTRPVEPEQAAPEADGTLRMHAGTLAILAGAHVVGSMAFITFATMAPFIRDELHLSATQFGFLITGYFLTQGILALPIGAIIDHVGIRAALAFANIAILTGALLFSIAQSQVAAMLAMAVLGVGYCFVNPSTSKAVFQLIAPRRRGTAMGIKQTGVPIGGVLGAAVGGLAGIVPWRWLMAAVGLTALAFAISALWLPRPAASTVSHAQGVLSHLRHMRTVIADRNLTIFNASAGLYQAAQFSFFGYITLFLREVMLASQPVAAACLGIAQMSSATGRMTWGAISDFVFAGRRKPVLLIMTGIATAGLVLLAGLSPRWSMAAAVALSAVLGLSVAGYVALVQTIVVETADPNHTATSVAYNRLFVSVGASIGPPLYGWTLDTTGSYATAWLTTAGLVFAALILFWTRFREHTRLAPATVAPAQPTRHS